MEKKGRKISEKQIKLIVVVAVVIIVVGLLFWGMIPEKIYEISEIMKNKEDFDGKEFNVKGLVSNWNLSSNDFILVDSFNSDLSIDITHYGAFSEGFGNNVTIVVMGTFNTSINHIESHSIQIGCPSKY